MRFSTAVIQLLLFVQSVRGNETEITNSCSKLCRNEFKNSLDASVCRPALNVSPKPKVYKACVAGTKAGFNDACISTCLGDIAHPDSYSLCKKKGFSMQSESYCRSGYEQAFKSAVDIANDRKEELLNEPDEEASKSPDENMPLPNIDLVMKQNVDIEKKALKEHNEPAATEEKKVVNATKGKTNTKLNEAPERDNTKKERMTANKPKSISGKARVQEAKVNSVPAVEKHDHRNVAKDATKAEAEVNAPSPQTPSVDLNERAFDQVSFGSGKGSNKEHVPQPSPVITEDKPEGKVIKGGITHDPSPVPSPEMPVNPRVQDGLKRSVRGQVKMEPKNDVLIQQNDSTAPEISPSHPPAKVSPTNIYEDLVAKPKDSAVEL
mmetsp:Transcript_1234/g.1780  ORF Transcript_1234/g.1780 Transcript_1234/m.1780 type:complete len:379 (-) Transcript_1234:122-1258(-)|eukprot:CAMPEP_0116019088 /NCGR_PEP_ID=MMETSP0321-20121206/9024_1 /TAXON_ID=163516 /ORGANISM="Leptocylindrus danicus var. danicus, Strain B650" /LENGTH=378 /DNA_ID=CAMNT_0003489583 /DNA_START=1895 /DNA_END=3031 /DNA_ORIENTATION=+